MLYIYIYTEIVLGYDIQGGAPVRNRVQVGEHNSNVTIGFMVDISNDFRDGFQTS